MQFRKLAAIGGSALMTGLSLAGAAMAATNVGNLADLAAPVAGAAHFPLFVVGKDAKTSDVAGAIGVAARFAAESKTAVAATTSPTVGAVEGGVNVATGGTPMYVGNALSVARASLSSADLTTILADGKFTDASGTSYSYNHYIDLGSTSAAIYGKTGDLTEPSEYVNVTSSASSSSYIYALRASFVNAINITRGTTGASDTTSVANSVAGQAIKLFGSDWTVGTDSTATKFVLYGSGDLKTLGYKTPVEVTVGGTKHTIEMTGVTSTTAAYLKVDNGVEESFTKGSIYNKGSPAFTIYVKDVKYASSTDQTQNTATLQLGANKIALPNGAAATKGVNDDTISGTNVALSVTSTTAGNAGYGQLTKLIVYIGVGDSNKAYVKKGGELLDPVFGTVKVKFSGFTPALDATTRDTVKFGQSSTTLSADLPDKTSGKSVVVNWAYDSATSTSGTLLALNWTSDKRIVVMEGHPIHQSDYFTIEAAGEGHLFQYTNADSTGSGTPKYSFLDVFSGETKTAAFASAENATSESFSLNGQQVLIQNLTSAGSSRATGYNPPPIQVVWKIGSDPAWRSAPAQSETDSLTAGATGQGGGGVSGGPYIAVWPGITLKSGYKVFITVPNTTWGGGTGPNATWGGGLRNNTVQRFLLPTGYLTMLFTNTTTNSAAAANATWFNMTASDASTGTTGGTTLVVTNDTTAGSGDLAVGTGSRDATAFAASGYGGPGGQLNIIVGRQWYNIQTNSSNGLALQVNFSLNTSTTAQSAGGGVTQPALLFVSPKNAPNNNYESFTISATDTSTGAALTTTPGTSETTGVSWFSGTSGATPTTTKYYNYWGALLTQDTNSQGALSVSIPASQSYPTVLILEKSSTGGATTTTASTSYSVVKVTADIARLDTELAAADKTNSDLIVVGGPCVNKVAADLLGKTYPACADETATSDADALSKTGIPKNAAIVKVFADKYATGKVAVLIAGWRAADTDLAAGAVQQDKLAGKTDMAVKVSGTDVASATIGAFS